jgi:hypothetical protein
MYNSHFCKFARKSILQLHFLVIFICLLLTSCASYKIPTAALMDTKRQHLGNISTSGSFSPSQVHPLYRVIPKHRSQIQWYDLAHWATWMFFGNDDDGIFGEEKKTPYRLQESPSLSKAIKWACRNPLHNFCFYVIGNAHCINSEFAILKLNRRKICFCTYRSTPEPHFEKPFFFLGFHGWKPFIAVHVYYNQKYRGQFYLGWRERGNFGIKFLPFVKRKLRKHELL